MEIPAVQHANQMSAADSPTKETLCGGCGHKIVWSSLCDTIAMTNGGLLQRANDSLAARFPGAQPYQTEATGDMNYRAGVTGIGCGQRERFSNYLLKLFSNGGPKTLKVTRYTNQEDPADFLYRTSDPKDLRVHLRNFTHGGEFAVARGIREAMPEGSKVYVVTGDGDASIGLGELEQCARRGDRLVIVVQNNFNYGMTGGQPSPFTPPGQQLPMRHDGTSFNMEDICRKLSGEPGVTYIGRTWIGSKGPTNRDKKNTELGDMLAEASLASEHGLAVVEVLDICTREFAAHVNALNFLSYFTGRELTMDDIADLPANPMQKMEYLLERVVTRTKEANKLPVGVLVDRRNKGASLP